MLLSVVAQGRKTMGVQNWNYNTASDISLNGFFPQGYLGRCENCLKCAFPATRELPSAKVSMTEQGTEIFLRKLQLCTLKIQCLNSCPTEYADQVLLGKRIPQTVEFISIFSNLCTSSCPTHLLHEVWRQIYMKNKY